MIEKPKKKAVVLLSGGMDSTTAAYWAKDKNYELIALAFDYKSKHNDSEFACAQRTATRLGIELHRIPLDFINDMFKSDLLSSGGEIPEGHYAEETMKRTVVPFRNGIMLSCAIGFAESHDCEAVIIGNHAGDHAVYPDCRTEFILALSAAAHSGTYSGVQILSPFCEITKADIAKLGDDLLVNWTDTWSCYKASSDIHCGRCSTCVERAEAFHLAGTMDPTKYEDPDFWKQAVADFESVGIPAAKDEGK